MYSIQVVDHLFFLFFGGAKERFQYHLDHRRAAEK